MLGSPVIDEAGVLGQVTRVYPLISEVTLLTDQDAGDSGAQRAHRRAQRGLRRAGAAAARMELRFMAGNADVQVGDLLTTSGVDGVYPPGLPVAKVAEVDRKADSGFARIMLRARGAGRRRAPCAGARADRRCSCRRGPSRRPNAAPKPAQGGAKMTARAQERP